MPVKDNVSITVPQEWDGRAVHIRIIDIHGRVVMSATTDASSGVGTSPVSIPIDLSNGLYAVECMVGGEAARSVIVVEK
jgi:hypothetical protein